MTSKLVPDLRMKRATRNTNSPGLISPKGGSRLQRRRQGLKGWRMLALPLFLVPVRGVVSGARINPFTFLPRRLPLFLMFFSHFSIYSLKRPLLELYAFSEGTSGKHRIKEPLKYSKPTGDCRERRQ